MRWSSFYFIRLYYAFLALHMYLSSSCCLELVYFSRFGSFLNAVGHLLYMNVVKWCHYCFEL